VKEGAIIPCGPAIEFAMEKAADPIRLFVCTGSDGSFTLYEDENVNYNYEKGAFATIPLHYSEQRGVLTIGKREGEFPGMLNTRTFEIVWVGKHGHGGLDFQSKPDVTVTYDGSTNTVKVGRVTK
jgi:alpha-D-xyloside xylohydrolase